MFDLVPFGRRPRHEVQDFFRGMDDLLKQIWHDFPTSEVTGNFGAEWTPRLDVTEGKKEITVKADLPGLESKDLDILIERDLLTIKGERKHEKEEKNEHFHRVERTYGVFNRTLRLPTEVDKDKVDATFKNGVLTITRPKTEEARKHITHVKVH